MFFNPDLSVMFPDSANRIHAQDICYQTGQTDPNPSLNRECYFDLAVLKNDDLAMNTANSLDKVVNLQSIYGNYHINPKYLDREA